MKKVFKIIFIIFIVLLLICLGLYRFFSGPSVGIKERMEIKEYAKNYLTMKYGDYNYKITGVRYEYDMDTIFDYSNPVGYWVDFKSDVVSDSWLTINGLISDDYEVNSDYFIQDYYFPDMDGYDVGNMLDDMEPKDEFESILLNSFKEEFEPDIYEIECDYMRLTIPDDYGRIPTLEEIKTDVNLYRASSFDYGVSNSIKDVDEYKNKLKEYIKDKYDSDADVYFSLENTFVSVFLEDNKAITVELMNNIDGNFRTYYEMPDGTWKFGDNVYKYRLEISGRMPNAAKDTTYVYLSNIEDISFHQAMMASGLSSNTEDYFELDEAVLVEIN